MILERRNYKINDICFYFKMLEKEELVKLKVNGIKSLIKYLKKSIKYVMDK